MSAQIIADEIHFMGYVVGILAQTGVPATVMGEFEHGMNNGTLFEDEPQLCDECANEIERGGPAEPDPDAYDDALTDIERTAKEYAKNGLLRLTDLATIIKQLREETE